MSYEKIIESCLKGKRPSDVESILLSNLSKKSLVENELKVLIEQSKNLPPNPKYWAKINDIIRQNFKYTFDEYTYHTQDILRSNEIFPDTESAARFAYEFSQLKLIEAQKNNHFSKRQYTITEIAALVQRNESIKLDPNSIRAAFFKEKVKAITKWVNKIAFESNYTVEELMSLDKRNLIIYTRLYFSAKEPNRVADNKNTEIIFTDQSAIRAKVYYRLITSPNAKKEFTDVFDLRIQLYQKESTKGFTQFKVAEEKKWKKLKSRFNSSSTEYLLVNKYLKFLRNHNPKWATDNKFSFGVNATNKHSIMEVLTKIKTNLDIPLFDSTKTTDTDFLNIISAEDFRKHKPIYFACETFYIATLFQQLKLNFQKIEKSEKFFIPTLKKPSLASVAEKSSLTHKPLKRTNLHNHINRLKNNIPDSSIVAYCKKIASIFPTRLK